MNKAETIQKEYYSDTANSYDNLHLSATIDTEHDFALSFLSGIIKHLSIESILDVGAGTGRALTYIKMNHPNVKVTGIEPVAQLREIGHKKGIEESELIDGNANFINFQDKEFDLVCEFGVLHHVERPNIVINEMLRVSKKAIFLSDSNNFGKGHVWERFLKQGLRFLGLWKSIIFLRTFGKGYFFSDEDGLFYSYSVFNNYKQIRKSCKSVHILNTKDGEQNLYRTASQIGLLGLK